jgi:membrane fusion protein, copper/silver efflux system
VSANQAKSLKPGMYVSVKPSGEDEKSTNVRVSRILPFYKEGANYVQVRTSIPNGSNNWKVGEQVEMQLVSGNGTGKWLPKTAVLHLGGRNVVFVKTNDSFKPVSIVVKSKADDFVNVGNSLGNDVEVVENVWFVVDSESFIKPEGGSEND